MSPARTRRSVFIDSPVVLYALGKPHPLREPCRAVLAAAQRGELELHASVELVQEVTFHRLRTGGVEHAVGIGRLLLEACVLYPVTREVMARSLDLIERSPVRGRDALHAATALEHGFTEIVTTDPGFVGVPGLGLTPPEQVITTLPEGRG